MTTINISGNTNSSNILLYSSNGIIDTDNLSHGYVGVNMAPCLYCKHNIGVHYHSVIPNSEAWPNYADGKHMCTYCHSHPGDYHIHTPK